MPSVAVTPATAVDNDPLTELISVSELKVILTIVDLEPG
jgi:hypothetical protein